MAATITQITSSTVTAEVQGNTFYTLHTSQSPNTGFNATNISFRTPYGATKYSFTYTPISGTYLALIEDGGDAGANNKLYIDQQHGIAVASRLANITNVTSGTSFDIQCSSPTTFYNLTSTATALTGFRMIGPDPTQTGVYFVLRNNTASNYLTLTPSSAVAPLTPATTGGIPNPLVIPPGTSANLVWNGSGYTMF